MAAMTKNPRSLPSPATRTGSARRPGPPRLTGGMTHAPDDAPAARLTSYENDGLTFDVRDEGPLDGEPVVLLHGFPDGPASWNHVVPLLTAAGLRVLVPAQRGYSPGARPKERAAYRLDTLARDVLALADAAGLDTFHVVGHDWGGGVAWQLGISHGRRLRTLTVASTPHPRAMVAAMTHSTQAFRSWYMAVFQIPRFAEWNLHLRGGELLARNLEKGGLPKAEAAGGRPAAAGARRGHRGAQLVPGHPPGRPQDRRSCRRADALRVEHRRRGPRSLRRRAHRRLGQRPVPLRGAAGRVALDPHRGRRPPGGADPRAGRRRWPEPAGPRGQTGRLRSMLSRWAKRASRTSMSCS